MLEWHEIVQFAFSGGGVVAVIGLGRLISWKAKVDARLQQFTERFDGAGNRKGVFNILDEIQTELHDAREAGAREHTAIREEMRASFHATDQLVTGVIGEFGELRGELRGAGFVAGHAPRPPGSTD